MIALLLGILQLVSVTPLPAFERHFDDAVGFSGADGAHSVALPDGRVFWLFGDTFTAEVRGGRRASLDMLRNSGAIQADGRFSFVGEVLPAAGGEDWFWPGDMAVVDGRLYVFLMRIRPDPEGPPGFQFEEAGADLLCVDDPSGDPGAWKHRVVRLGMRLGAACVVAGDWLYAYGIVPGRTDRPLFVARIHRARLAALNPDDWEVWGAGGWARGAARALFLDGAPEMSVSRVPGIPGFVAVYTPSGLGPDVMARHADRPEGPWSAPLRLYTAPERGLLIYGARAHPEQSTAAGEAIVTYNRNLLDPEAHVTRPEVYRPRALRVRLAWNGQDTSRDPWYERAGNRGDRRSPECR